MAVDWDEIRGSKKSQKITANQTALSYPPDPKPMSVIFRGGMFDGKEQDYPMSSDIIRKASFEKPNPFIQIYVWRGDMEGDKRVFLFEIGSSNGEG